MNVIDLAEKYVNDNYYQDNRSWLIKHFFIKGYTEGSSINIYKKHENISNIYLIAYMAGYDSYNSSNINTMNELKISIPEGHEIDQFNKETGVITFKKKESKYPQNIQQCNIPGGNVAYSFHSMSSAKRVQAIRALCQLVELRDAWNKIDEFVVDWENTQQTKYVIEVSCNNISDVRNFNTTQKILYFKSKDARDLFLTTFKDLIEEAKEFL